MMNQYSIVNRQNAEQIARSLERLSVFDQNGKMRTFSIPHKEDFEKLFKDTNIPQIQEEIQRLKKEEEQLMKEERIEEASRISQELAELREKEILLKNYLIVENNQKAYEELKQLNEQQIAKFNSKWDEIIQALSDESRKIEQDLLDQHEAEKRLLEEQVSKLQVPATKFSSNLLNDKFRLQQLIRSKKYQSAREIKENIDKKEEDETLQFQQRFYEQIDKKKQLLFKKQKNEYEALKSRLEKNINQKLKQRMIEYEKLLQRIQNLQNELITKQTVQFSKIQAINAKVLQKYQLDFSKLVEEYQESPNNQRNFQKQNMPEEIQIQTHEVESINPPQPQNLQYLKYQEDQFKKPYELHPVHIIQQVNQASQPISHPLTQTITYTITQPVVKRTSFKVTQPVTQEISKHVEQPTNINSEQLVKQQQQQMQEIQESQRLDFDSQENAQSQINQRDLPVSIQNPPPKIFQQIPQPQTQIIVHKAEEPKTLTEKKQAQVVTHFFQPFNYRYVASNQQINQVEQPSIRFSPFVQTVLVDQPHPQKISYEFKEKYYPQQIITPNQNPQIQPEAKSEDPTKKNIKLGLEIPRSYYGIEQAQIVPVRIECKNSTGESKPQTYQTETRRVYYQYGDVPTTQILGYNSGQISMGNVGPWQQQYQTSQVGRVGSVQVGKMESQRNYVQKNVQ